VGFVTHIWRKAEDDLHRRRAATARPEAYDRGLRLLHTLEPYMGHPARVAHTIGTALSAPRPRARYRVGPDAFVLQAAEALLPRRAKDRLLRAVLGI
jgi:hypothetical protein